MSLAVTISGSASNLLDVRWRSFLYAQNKSAVVSVRETGSAGVHAQEWMAVVDDATASGIRLDMSRCPTYGSTVPTVAVNGCTPMPVDSTGGLERRFKVDNAGSSSSLSAADGGLGMIFSGLSLMTPRVTSAGSSDLPIVQLERQRVSCGLTNPSISVERDTYRNATITWLQSLYRPDRPDKMQITIENVTHASSRIFIVGADTGRLDIPDRLRPGNRYRVTVKGLKQCSPPAVGRHVECYTVTGESSAEFKAELTESDLNNLLQKAIINTYSHTNCYVVYRNKSPSYFSQVLGPDRGIMRVYAKDNSGDPASPINGQIDGLFFMAEVEPGTDGEPYHASAFGSTRLIVPVDVLLELAPNVFFADFYCMRGRFHYVTLVLTRRGSVADRFCREHRLPEIGVDDRQRNRFLFRGEDDGRMKVAVGVKVELLFTEDIDVNELTRRRGSVMKENVPLIGKGSSTPGGLPKNASCHTCNLYPSDYLSQFHMLFGATSAHSAPL